MADNDIVREGEGYVPATTIVIPLQQSATLRSQAEPGLRQAVLRARRRTATLPVHSPHRRLAAPLLDKPSFGVLAIELRPWRPRRRVPLVARALESAPTVEPPR